MATLNTDLTNQSDMGAEDNATIVLGLVTLGLLFFIFYLRKKNVARIEEGPAVAGDDEIGGAAVDPEQFTKPDDEALDEMESLLKDAAESQGLDYEE
uniref:LPXTG cell wall anchor domain-containing protein n=1 Tax=uncultured marine group II/III euryarchaeote KM3_51_E06 TaxID=1456455 RepID=A0A075H9Z6_9EURY|nr:hypothetical protein [uncultured marine group II/III euryarchaeote KM3_51_E06]